MIKLSSELRVGDIVRTDGMRVRLDEVQATYGVYHCPGTVLNLDEALESGMIPPTFLHTHKWEGGWVIDRRDFWVVQGNDLVTWTVED